MPRRPRALAFYLPQFHPIPENDLWWGVGFTEWTNVAKARPAFKDHYQPHLPADLGFYDLRLPEVRSAQATLAAEYGIHGFIYYHYWFSGRRLLERPFSEVLASGQPDFPFCLCWANEPWSRRWDGSEDEVLMAQTYDDEDDLAHMQHLVEAFQDPRYIRVGRAPLFLVYKSDELPDVTRTIKTWRAEARRLGIDRLYLCRVNSTRTNRVDPVLQGFDAAVDFQPDLRVAVKPGIGFRVAGRLGIRRGRYRHFVLDYAKFIERMQARPNPGYKLLPGVTPSWDNTARRASEGIVLTRSTPEQYQEWLTDTLGKSPFRGDEDLVFVNGWNEWAEGNHLEPDQRWGRRYLEAHLAAMRSVASQELLREAPERETPP